MDGQKCQKKQFLSFHLIWAVIISEKNDIHIIWALPQQYLLAYYTDSVRIKSTSPPSKICLSIHLSGI